MSRSNEPPQSQLAPSGQRHFNDTLSVGRQAATCCILPAISASFLTNLPTKLQMQFTFIISGLQESTFQWLEGRYS